VRVEDVEKPKMEHPDDIIVKVTTVSPRPSWNWDAK
jgi:threonine dehydrogenase-like Zn-dependent dehydrogenase